MSKLSITGMDAVITVKTNEEAMSFVVKCPRAKELHELPAYLAEKFEALLGVLAQDKATEDALKKASADLARKEKVIADLQAGLAAASPPEAPPAPRRRRTTKAE